MIAPDVSDLVRSVISVERRWLVVEGDCRDLFAMLPDASVDHVITDPPYSEHVHSKSRAGARSLTDVGDIPGRCSHKPSNSAISRAVDFGFDALSEEMRDVCGRHFRRVAKRWRLVFSDIESCHLWRIAMAEEDYVRTGIWHKIGATPQFTGDRPAVAAEAITISHASGRKRWNGGGRHGIWSYPIELDRLARGRTPRVHPTQKPLALMLALVADFTDPGDLILDPFGGSGTTAVAALRLGRRVIVCELDPRHAAVARERLEAEAAGSTLAAQRDGQVALFGREIA